MQVIVLGVVSAVLLGVAVTWVRQVLRESKESRATKELYATATGILEEHGVEAPVVLDVEVDRRVPGTSREQRQQWVRERAKTGLCRYCDEPAIHPYPSFKPVRPLLDGLYRYFNVTANVRWQVVTGEKARPISPKHVGMALFDLCEQHHEQVRGMFDERIARERADRARFDKEQRLAIYEFSRFIADEQAAEDALQLRRGKKKVQLAAVAQFPKKAGTG